MTSRSHNQSINRRERRVGGREDLGSVFDPTGMGSVFDPTGMGSGEGDLGSQQICWVE